MVKKEVKKPILSTDTYGRSKIVYDSDIPKNVRYQWALEEIERIKSQIPEAQRVRIEAAKAWDIAAVRKQIGGLSIKAWEKKYATEQLKQIRNKISVLRRYAEQNKLFMENKGSSPMKKIHLKCGHDIQVRSWPSSAGMAKMRHHYKKFHPARMKKITKKSLETKRKKGLIKNRCNPFGYRMKKRLPKRHTPLRLLKQYEKDYLDKTLGRGWGLMPKPTIMRVLKKLKRNPIHKPVVIYDKLLGIEARKGRGKFAGQNFKHDFKPGTDAMVIGNPDGSLTIRSKKG